MATPRVDADSTPAPAKKLIDEAAQAAKVSHKAVLVYFRGDISKDWQWLDDIMRSAEVGKLLADHYVLVRLVYATYNNSPEDVATAAKPNPDASVMLNKFEHFGRSQNPPQLIAPIIVVLDSTQQIIGTAHEDPAGKSLVPQEFDDLLTRTAPRMTAADRKRITDYLTQHSHKP